MNVQLFNLVFSHDLRLFRERKKIATNLVRTTRSVQVIVIFEVGVASNKDIAALWTQRTVELSSISRICMGFNIVQGCVSIQAPSFRKDEL